MAEGATRSRWAPRSVRSGRCGAVGGEQVAARLAGRGQDGEASSGRSDFLLRAEGPGRRPGARLCPPWWTGGWPVAIGVPLSESIQVWVGVLRLGGEAAVRTRTGRVRGLAPWSSGSSTAPAPPCGLAPHPVPPGPAEALRRARTRRAPALRSGPARPRPRREGPGATAPGPPGPESRDPDLVRRDSRRRPAGRAGGRATSTCIQNLGGTRSAWRPSPGCCTRKAVGYATGGNHTRHRPWCARRSIWRPAGARTRQGKTVFHSIPLGPGVPVHL